jgi:Protein of unknown function (DUF4240)
MPRQFFLLLTVLILAACGRNNSNKQNNNSKITMATLKKDQKMDTAYFWSIMNYGFEKGNFENKVRSEVILNQLIKLTPEQIVEFEFIFQQLNLKASTWNNFAAQTIIEGSSSDDRFFYFRCWLISLGQKNFDETLKNPDYLATLNIPFNKQYNMMYCQFEELISMSDRAYEIVTKKDPSTDSTFPRTYVDKKGLFYDSHTDFTGKEWIDNDDLPKIAPLLDKKYSHK